MKATPFERWALVPVLVAYVVLLVLAAWRHEVRPAVFDRVTNFARGALGLVGIPPAVAVFSADTGSAPDAKIAEICLEVRGLRDAGAQRQIYPGLGASCPEPAPRLWVRGEQVFLHRSVVSLRAAVAAHRSGASAPGRMRFAKLLADSIGAHFVRRDGLMGGSADRYLLLWREARISYRTRARSDRIVALFDWRSAAEPEVFIAWKPVDALMRSRGWEPKEP